MNIEQLLNELAEFHFLRPEWFLALIPALLLFIFLLNRRSAQGSWQKIVAPHLLPHLLQGSIGKKSRFPIFLILVCWILAVLGMAGPTWEKIPQAVQKKVDAQVIVLDLSLSMFAQDISPSRLTRAKHKLSDILSKSNEGLTGLVVFAGTPHVVTPLTDDNRTILSMVDSLSPDIMPIPGGDSAAAVIKAKEVLNQGGIPQGHIILITDDIKADFVDRVKAEVDVQDMPVSIFAIGTKDGSPIPLPGGNFVKNQAGSIVIAKVNQGALKIAAKQLRGRFTTLTYSDDDIDYLLGFKANLLDQEMKDTERDFDTWDEAGHWLVVLILPFAAMGYRKGWLGSFVAVICISGLFLAAPPAQADIWQDLWQTKDQQGQKAWRQKHYQQAAEKFSDPLWKGSAHYRSENYEAAAEEFAKLDTAESHYNRGNALAKQQLIDEAIGAYEKALSHDPEMQDAKDNLALLEQLKEQQEQQQGDGDSDESQDSQENQDQQQDQQQNQEQDQSQQDQNNDQQEQDGENQPSQQSEDGEKDPNQQQQQDQQQQDQQDSAEQEEQNQQAQNEQQENEEQEPQPLSPQLQETQESAEDQQALQQWLERVPDEPGGLLRRKFKLESRLRNQSNLESQAW
ncbi:MAG: VWA domain-containing protein [Pseudomonadales bacterium]|nr:VWA domain-containing protein [Pseudomonadales bacterium]